MGRAFGGSEVRVMPTESLNSQPSAILQARIIVARNRPLVWQALTDHFTANEDVELVLDRRRGERRQRVQTHKSDRRKEDRRGLIGIEHNVHHREYVIVPAEERQSGGTNLGSTGLSDSGRVVWGQSP